MECQGCVCVYHDDVRPGNVHRPEFARLYLCFYWMLIDLPEWWSHSLYGWFELAYVPVRIIEKLRGGMAALFDRLIEAMKFPIRIDATALTRSFTFNFHVVLADEKALSASFGWKGAGSYHPCGVCKNILGRFSEADITAPFLHYSHRNADDFDLWTFEDFQHKAGDLAIAWGGTLRQEHSVWKRSSASRS